MAKMADKPEVKETPAQAYRKLLEKAEALKAKAVEQLKTEIEEKITELNEYGYTFRFTDKPDSAPPKVAKVKGTSKPPDPNKVCKQCGATGHDARFHRAENIAKKKGEQLPLQ